MPPQTRKPVAKSSKAAAPAAPQQTQVQQPVSVSAAPISGRIERAQAHKAFKALAAHMARMHANKSATELPLDGARNADNAVLVQLTVKELSTERKIKPAMIPLTHALLGESDSVCLLTKDPQREYKDLLAEKNIRSISRVVGVAKLRGKFKPFDARRELVRDHDLFLADERIVPMLPKLCGKVFYDARKFPVPVDIEHRKRLGESIARAIASTYFMQNKGSCTTVKIGFINRHTPEQLVDNLATALPAIVAKIPGKWSNVQNIEVKTGRSAALPIWNTSLGAGPDSRWAPAEKRKRAESGDEQGVQEQGVQEHDEDEDEEEVEDEVEDEAEDEDEDEDEAEDEDEEEEAPALKAKPAAATKASSKATKTSKASAKPQKASPKASPKAPETSKASSKATKSKRVRV